MPPRTNELLMFTEECFSAGEGLPSTPCCGPCAHEMLRPVHFVTPQKRTRGFQSSGLCKTLCASLATRANTHRSAMFTRSITVSCGIRCSAGKAWRAPWISASLAGEPQGKMARSVKDSRSFVIIDHLLVGSAIVKKRT